MAIHSILRHLFVFACLIAAHVVDEAFAASTPKFHRLLSDLPAASLGLNGAGGSAASSVLKALGNGATMISYGAMKGGEAVRVPADAFVTRGITLKGFSLADTLAAMGSKDKRDAAVREVVSDVSGGEKNAKVRMLLAREPFADFTHALARAMQSGERKVVLVMPK
jgi:NADPH:quinone reductase-like Zn-dependent oxidoreductase